LRKEKYCVSDNIRSLVEEHHAFYEVLPYYGPAENGHLSHPAGIQRVQAGFNVDIYGVRTADDEPMPPPAEEYGLGWAELQRIADTVSEYMADSCSLEVIPFPSVAIIDARNGKVESLIRLRISHRGGIHEPIGVPEQRALEEIEKTLRTLGVTPRQ
jgi:hypothetical protein